MNNIVNNKFHYYLKHLASPETTIRMHKGVQIICEKNGNSQVLEDAILPLLRYLMSNAHHLNTRDVSTLQTLHAKIRSNPISSTLHTNVDQCFNDLISKNGRKNYLHALPIAHCIRQTPHTAEELQHNLSLVANFYPKYTLDNDLTVYDTTFNSFPVHHEPETICNKLQTIGASIGNLYTPQKAVSIAILLYRARDDVSESALEGAIAHNIPLLFTKPFMSACAPIVRRSLIKHDLYLQQNGNFALLIAKGQDPAAHGFTTAHTGKDNNKALVPHKLPLPPTTPLDYTTLIQDLDALLALEGYVFHRTFSIDGHGAPEEAIAELPVTLFPPLMEVLSRKNTRCLMISSCYVAGSNREYICLPDKTIPFPVILTGIADTATTNNSRNTKALVDAHNILQSQLNTSKGHRISFSNHDLHTLAVTYSGYDTLAYDRDNNLPTLLLPASRYESAITPTVPANVATIQDVHRSMQQNAYKIVNNKLQIQPAVISSAKVPSMRYIFSAPVTEAVIDMGSRQFDNFISVGGTAHHFIKEISTTVPLQDFIQRLLNCLVIRSDEVFPEPACKVFAIATVTVGWERTAIKNVVITMKEQERWVIFLQPNQSGYTHINYTRGGGQSFWAPEKETIISLDEARHLMYTAFEQSTGNVTSQLQQERNAQFYEAVRSYFLFIS